MQVLYASNSKIQIRSAILYGIYLVNHRFTGSLQCFIQHEATAAFNICNENLLLKTTVHRYFQSRSENSSIVQTKMQKCASKLEN